jgi:hypothetical protein
MSPIYPCDILELGKCWVSSWQQHAAARCHRSALTEVNAAHITWKRSHSILSFLRPPERTHTITSRMSRCFVVMRCSTVTDIPC